MASFEPAQIQRINPSFFLCLGFYFFLSRGKQKAGAVKRISACELNRGAPFMAVYELPSSKTHIQITPSFPSSSLRNKDDCTKGRGMVQNCMVPLFASVQVGIYMH